MNKAVEIHNITQKKVEKKGHDNLHVMKKLKEDLNGVK